MVASPFESVMKKGPAGSLLMSLLDAHTCMWDMYLSGSAAFRLLHPNCKVVMGSLSFVRLDATNAELIKGALNQALLASQPWCSSLTVFKAVSQFALLNLVNQPSTPRRLSSETKLGTAVVPRRTLAGYCSVMPGGTNTYSCRISTSKVHRSYWSPVYSTTARPR